MEQALFSSLQELKNLRTRCGKVYSLGGNRYRAVVYTTPVHQYDTVSQTWIELSSEQRQQMSTASHSVSAGLVDDSSNDCSTAGIVDTYVREGSTQDYSTAERLWITNTNNYGKRLTYIKVVDLPRLGANHFITSAKLCVHNV